MNPNDSMPQFPGMRGMVAGQAAMAPYNQPPELAYSLPAMDFSCISPYNIPFWNDLPPAFVTGDVRLNEAGAIILGSRLLGGLGIDVADPLFNPHTQQPKGPYGDMQTLRLTLAAGQGLRVLGRSIFKRVLLQIQNRDAANDINFNFGAPASSLHFGIPAGGSSSWLDAVPQNELWLFSTAGANVVIGYIDSQPEDSAT